MATQNHSSVVPRRDSVRAIFVGATRRFRARLPETERRKEDERVGQEREKMARWKNNRRKRTRAFSRRLPHASRRITLSRRRYFPGRFFPSPTRYRFRILRFAEETDVAPLVTPSLLSRPICSSALTRLNFPEIMEKRGRLSVYLPIVARVIASGDTASTIDHDPRETPLEGSSRSVGKLRRNIRRATC